MHEHNTHTSHLSEFSTAADTSVSSASVTLSSMPLPNAAILAVRDRHANWTCACVCTCLCECVCESVCARISVITHICTGSKGQARELHLRVRLCVFRWVCVSV